MHLNDDQVSQRITELLESNAPNILYIGAEVKDLSPIIYKQPWSCIITSTTNEEIVYRFEITDKRMPRLIKEYDEMHDKVILSQREPNVIYVNGYGESSKFKQSFREDKLRKASARKMIELIPELLKSNFGSLFIIGCNTNNEEEIEISILYDAIQSMKKHSVFMFGVQTETQINPYINDLIQHEQVQAFSFTLTKLLEDIAARESLEESKIFEYMPQQDKDSDAIYINKKRVSISHKILFDTQGFVRLLSESEVGDTSCPSHLSAEYFYKFLKESVKRPIWYGYENGFNLQRDFEPLLESVVMNELTTSKDTSDREAVLLSGQTSSSKSIALGALALKIYAENEYPVLFINNPEINLDQGSPNFQALDVLIQKIEEYGAKKVLLIWDNSSALAQLQLSKKLQISLMNRGRKIVLVCSAYEQPESFYKNTKCISEVFKGNGFKTVKANISLSSSEMTKLREMVVDKGEISTDDFNRWVKQNDVTNLLTLLYTLMQAHLSAELSYGLQQEVEWGTGYLSYQINNMHRQESQQTILSKAFQEAGYKISELIQSENESEQSSKILKGFEDFCNTIATSYQMKISLPLSMALRCMNLPMDNNFSQVQDALYDVPFLQIISPEIDESGYDYLVAFRTPLEAELYLGFVGITPDQQIDYIVSMIKNISISGEYNKFSESATVERIIRVIGPNCNDPKQKQKNNKYKLYYPQIIDALTDLRINQRISDPRLICQEVVWMREVYGATNSEFTFDKRKQKLQQALKISRDTIDKIEISKARNVNTITRNNLIVESAICELKLYDLLAPNPNIQSVKTPRPIFDFRVISQQLCEVISYDPTNTYPYTALLRLFRAVYNSDDESADNKIQYLSNVTSVIDDVESQGREVEDNQEYQGYKAEILKYISEERYKEYYDELIKKGSASGVHLKAHKMLEEANIDYKRNLVDAFQKEKAQEIVAFLKSNINVVQNHPGCLYMLISLVWLLYNGTPIFKGEEQQLTHMTRKQWDEIKSLCDQYERQFLRGDENKPFNAPTMYYLLALSSAQLDDYQASIMFFGKINESMFYSQIRTKVWHIICEEDGTPRKFRGDIDSRKYNPIRKNGKVNIRTIPATNGGVFFYGPNLRLKEIGGIRSDFEIGTSFIGFTAFRQIEDRRL